ncbi:MAG: RES family NAD+ phosphorylase [Candidatus Velthaea sp.]
MRLARRPGAELRALADLVDGDPHDLQSILEVLALTDARARDAAGAFSALPPADQYRGSGAAAVMIPFLSPAISRFSDGSFGVLYGAATIDTAKAEVSYHHSLRLDAASAPPGTNVILALWEFESTCDLADLRSHDSSIYDPASYVASQSVGRRLRTAGTPGVLYASVRHSGGECIGLFIPRCVTSMLKRDDWRLVWDGSSVSEILRVA